MLIAKNRIIFQLVVSLAVLFLPLRVYAENEILIGLIPEQNIFKQMDRYKPLATYLSEKVGVRIRLTVLSRYGDILERFASRHMDGAFFDSLTGAMSFKKLGVEPIARPVNLDGTATVRSYVFVRADSNIRTVMDMKGKRFAFVDKATATGYLFAIAFLHKNGVSNIDGYFSEYFFTGSHDSAIYSVLDNRADIGSAQSTIFALIAHKDPTIKKELRIIAESEEFPEATLCLKKDMGRDIKRRISETLLGMNQDPLGREVLRKFGAVKFIKAEISDFNHVFNLAAKVGIDIKGPREKK